MSGDRPGPSRRACAARPDMMSTATTQRAVAGPLRRAGSPDSPVVNTIGTARASAGAGLAWRRRVGAAFATTSPKRIERRARRGDSRTIETITVAAARGGDYGTSVGHESGPSGQAAPILAGVAFFGTFFAAMAMRKRRERQRRRARGDVARQRLRSAAGAGRVATRSDLAAQPASFPNPNYRWDSPRDIAFARTRGLVREDKSRGREEDYELLREYARRDEVAARENIARNSRAPRGGGSFRDDYAYMTTMTLGVTCPVREGQGVAVTGAAPALGSWNLDGAAAMTRVGADRWQVTFDTAPGPVEYRFALITRLANGGGARLETEVGPPRSAIAVGDPGARSQVFVDDRVPEFASSANLDWSARIRAGAAGNVLDGGGGRGRVPGSDAAAAAAAARRVAEASDVDVDAAFEALELTGGDEGRAGELLRTAARGVAAPPPPPGRRMAAPPQVATDRMRVDQVSDDVKVVEEFSDASDDELARLIADLRNEMKNN